MEVGFDGVASPSLLSTPHPFSSVRQGAAGCNVLREFSSPGGSQATCSTLISLVSKQTLAFWSRCYY